MQIEHLILFLLFTHFVADFICQNDWMAQGKSKECLPLFTHCVVYATVFIGTFLVLNSFVSVIIPEMVKYCLLNGAIHFCVDFVTSRINSRLWAAKEVHWFFVGIGADQLIHAATLILTLKMFV